jgi:hypothetical protein
MVYNGNSNAMLVGHEDADGAVLGVEDILDHKNVPLFACIDGKPSTWAHRKIFLIARGRPRCTTVGFQCCSGLL